MLYPYRRLSLVPFFLIIILISSTQAELKNFEIVPDEANLVQFISKAPGETFDGKTNQIEGWLKFNPENLSENVSGNISIPVKSLDTGLKLRNQHMMENHLHPDKYPVIEFQFLGFEDTLMILPQGQEKELKIRGNFVLHGVTREKIVDVKALLIDSTLRIQSDFTVSLSEHKIPRPKFLFLKLADIQEIKVNFKSEIK